MHSEKVRYGAGTKLGGIIHLHEINQLPRSAFHKYLDVFRGLCAEPRALILGTTKWGRNIKDGQGKPNSDSEQEYNPNSEQEHQGSAYSRERHLKNHYWKTLIDAGAKVYRFTRS
jgi:hypothetical protein